MSNKAYIRVSTERQITALQRKALKAEGCNVFYEEKMSSKRTDRPELQRMLSELKVGDVVLVHEISRLSRSVKDLLTIVESIKEKGASLKSLNESWLDTSNDNPMNEFLLNIFGSLAELERGLTLQRQREGIEIAKKAGKYKGRKFEVEIGGKKSEKAMQAIEWYKEGKSVRYICKTLSIGTGTLYSLLEREEIR
ncbi:recombinase family protein [Peribacillus sp. AS_2]|uniref:recombinase family protein n=1 Tax=Peribacillus sp. AS_2 TaxID=2996755 RepID=UPI0022A7AF6A|nr:recombinase family protein [Peribacillus sp. AS_2]MCZ0870913.1 recombinase family protein [Peribacillus sp. AS_2]